VVAPDGEAAAKLAADLALYLDRPVPVLPARGVLYGADVAPAPHVVGERQQALAALAAGGAVVAEAVALLERFLPLELQPRPLSLTPGAALAFDAAVAGLAALGYERVERVRSRGEFAVRGGLVDVYSALGDPLRVEFWGDQIDTVRTFSVYSQRSTGALDEATVWAAFEADAGLKEYQTGLHQAIASWERDGREESPDELYRRAGVRALAALAGRFTTAAELVASGGRRIAVFNPDETYRALADFAGEVELTVEGLGLRERLYVPLAEVRALLAGALQLDLVQRDQPVQLVASRPQFAARDLAGAERDLLRLVRDDYRVFVVFRHEGEAERATYRLRNLSAEVVTPEQLARGGEAGPGLYFVAAPLREGFVAADLKLAVVSERALLRAAPRERRFVAGTRLSTFFDVRPGDYVVHEDHGIARFDGIETRTVAGVTRDYLVLQFAVMTACAGRTTLSARSAGTWARAGDRRRWTSSAVLIGRRSRRGPARLWWRWPGSCCSCTRRGRPCPGTAFPRTVSSCAGWRTPSPSRRLRTKPRPSMMSRTTWRRRIPWTASSWATWATARPRWRCAPPSRPPRRASRRWCWCPPRSSPSSIP
jgi:transcription-repair coupling factor (superfamily II helicase)